MAIGRLSVGVGKKGKASPHALYIAREGKYQKPSTHAEKLESKGHGNMPQWAEHNPNYFWQCADEHERKNGSTYREHVIALPRELDENQRHELVKDWIKNEIGDKHAYQYAIHNPPAMDGKEQPHCHLMFSERLRDDIERDPDQYFKRYNSKNPDKGGAKKANTPKLANERKEELKALRDRWEKLCNDHLERAGRYERISMKTLKEQGIDREPVNYTMAQIQQPEIRQAYINELDAKEQAYQAKLDIYRALEGTPLVEINRQLREQERAKQEQAEKQARAKAREQAPKPTPQPPPPPPKEIKKQSEVTAVTEPSQNAFEENRQIFLDYANKVEDTAKEVLSKELADMKNKGMPLLAQYEELRDNKPLFFGKDKWEQDTQKALNAYNRFRDNYYSVKDKGVTGEHRERAKELIAEREPSYHAKAQRAIAVLTEMNKARNDAKAKAQGADKLAEKGKAYTGQILRADENGILQQTADGVVLHPPIKGIDEGKNYYLKNNGATYDVREERSYSRSGQGQDRGLER